MIIFSFIYIVCIKPTTKTKRVAVLSSYSCCFLVASLCQITKEGLIHGDQSENMLCKFTHSLVYIFMSKLTRMTTQTIHFHSISQIPHKQTTGWSFTLPGNTGLPSVLQLQVLERKKKLLLLLKCTCRSSMIALTEEPPSHTHY